MAGDPSLRSNPKRRLRPAIWQRRPLQPSSRQTARQRGMDWGRNPPANPSLSAIRHVSLPGAGSRPGRRRRLTLGSASVCLYWCELLTKAAARALYRWTRTSAEPKPSAEEHPVSDDIVIMPIIIAFFAWFVWVVF